MRVLDIGSGTGFVSAALAHLVFPRGEVIALDTDPAMLEYARKRLDKYHPQLSDMIQLIEHNGWTGYKNFAPYDGMT
jgi:protein-L-isoaspartate(D-aspartate) O-methyltransferase